MFALRKNIKSIDRLKKRSDFLCVQQKGRKWVAKGLIVEICDNQTAKLRFGITVSKKFSKLAVARNRLKRQLRSICLETLPDYQHHKLDVVLIGRLCTPERSFQELKTDLQWCLKKMDVLPQADINKIL